MVIFACLPAGRAAFLSSLLGVAIATPGPGPAKAGIGLPAYRQAGALLARKFLILFQSLIFEMGSTLEHTRPRHIAQRSFSKETDPTLVSSAYPGTIHPPRFDPVFLVYIL
ncbi:MAG: hypothetical protein Q8P49_04700 [Candidatus Liptonbacteria bacterium]|nr:hypothetical protein [Candidatus Liptonbacteria bacterium]